jgi:hypothetical protein
VEASGPSIGGVLFGLVRRFWILGLIALIGIGAVVFRDRLSGSAADLQVGDCFDVPPASVQEIEDVQHHPCTEPHTGEVFLVYDMPGGDEFPTEEEFFATFSERCVPAFAEYTGSDFETATSLDMTGITPTREGWRSGDRRITCVLVRIDGSPMTRSMKGTSPT